MLVLTRKKEETIKTIYDKATLQRMLAAVVESGEPIVVSTTVLRIKGNTIRLGVEAPKYIRVIRGEIEVETPEPVTEPATDTATESPADGD